MNPSPSPVLPAAAAACFGAALLASAPLRAQSGPEAPPAAPVTAASPDPQPRPSPTDWTGAPRLGPFELRSAAGDALRVGLATQLRGTVDVPSDGGSSLTVDLARLRASLSANLLRDSVRMLVQLNTLPGALELLDASATWSPHRRVAIAVGQQKTPYTVHRSQSFTTLALVDWGETTRWFGAERQLGLQVHDFGAGGLRYAFGVFTGQNARKAFAVRHSTVYVETVPNPSDLTEPRPREDLHPELFAQLGWHTPGMVVTTGTDEEGGPARFLAALSGSWDAAPVVPRDFTGRLAAEAVVKVSHVTASAVGHLGWLPMSDASDDAGANPLGLVGSQVEAAFRPVRVVELAARHGWVHVTEAVRDDARARADATIAAAPADERDALSATYATAGSLSDSHELTGGINVYFVGQSLKLQADASWLPSVVDGELASAARARLQLALTL